MGADDARLREVTDRATYVLTGIYEEDPCECVSDTPCRHRQAADRFARNAMPAALLFEAAVGRAQRVADPKVRFDLIEDARRTFVEALASYMEG